MELILLERVEKLGQMGDVVTVKDGYARNFLLPQKKAMRATTANKASFEAQKAHLEAQNLERKTEAESVAASMEGLKVVLIRAAGDSGQLYGSVTSRDIAEAVTEAGVSIGRTQVILDRALKTLGLHEVRVRLHPEVGQTVTLNIARSVEEAETQYETGAAVTGEIEDDLDDDLDEALEAADEVLAEAAEAGEIDASTIETADEATEKTVEEETEVQA